jgi:alkylation response protein AidB-like acyl-CoA dehydrogenase
MAETKVDQPAALPLTRPILTGRVPAIITIVRDQSAVAEQSRQLAEPAVQALRENGLHRILQPCRYGGGEAHFSGMVDIVETVSQACSAAGWCLTQYCSHNCLIGYFPPEGQDAVWGAMPDAIRPLFRWT